MAFDTTSPLSPTPIIKFGTDGWRGIIADDFTGANVRLVSLATANYLKRPEIPGQMIAIVGYDNRSQSEYFAREAAAVLSASGFKTILSNSSCSSPAVSRACLAFEARGGIMITASHNPPAFNGLKIKMGYGGPALPSHIAEVEKELRLLIQSGQTNVSLESGDYGLAEVTDLRPAYFAGLRAAVDIPKIAGAGYRIVADAMYGSGSGYLTSLLAPAGADVTEIRSERNPCFAGICPEPIPKNIEATVEAVRANRADVAVIIDGDADRIGALDSLGNFVDSHRIFALVLRHMVEVRGLRGSVVKSFSSSTLIDKMCAKYDLPVHVVPIGFKNICEWMIREPVLMGGEESGGLGIAGYIPERDGPLFALLLLETMAVRGQRLEDQIAELMNEFGNHEYDRIDLHPDVEKMPKIAATLTSFHQKEVAGFTVDHIDRTDGTKIIFSDGSWLLLRASGTESVVRVYAESSTRGQVNALLAAGKEVIEQQ